MYLVFDIGGSSTKYALIENEKIIKKASAKSLPTMDEFIKFLEDTVQSFVAEYDIEVIGFSSPGTVDSERFKVY